MNIVSYGGGVNSYAMLIGLYHHQIPIDLILFADTGAEFPYIYQAMEVMNLWLSERSLPQITVVQNVDRFGNRLSLEMECLRSKTLPSIAYGYKKCSQKHKIGPQNKFCNNNAQCKEVWQSGGKVNKFLGLDAGEQKRYKRSLEYDVKNKKYCNIYPLIEWGWNREKCIEVIKQEGLTPPGKSSCFFCPNMKREEIIRLKEEYPAIFQRAIDLEKNAIPNLTKLKGLGRTWSWSEKFKGVDFNNGND